MDTFAEIAFLNQLNIGSRGTRWYLCHPKNETYEFHHKDRIIL